MAEWDAEIELSVDDVRALVEAAHPHPEALGGQPELVAEGWDNAVWAVGGGWLYRFPRRQIAVEGVELECAVLARIAAHLPVAIPIPAALGAPSEIYPWPYFGYRAVPGEELARSDFGPARRARLAAPLGGALKALHAPELAEELGPLLPVDPWRRGEITRRVELLEDRVEGLTSRGFDVDTTAILEAAEPARDIDKVEPVCVVHGDLHIRHVLVDEAGDLSGIIDWGDLHFGNPSVDLSFVWLVLPPEARSSFFDAYGPVDETTCQAARVIALYLATVLAASSADFGLPDVERAALAALENALLV